MSVNAILSANTAPAQQISQAAGQNGQSYADWFAGLSNAVSGTSGAGNSSGTAQLSDQMQALLTQLQAGNTVAATGGSGGSVAASPAAGAAGQTHHHHHHHGSGGGGGGGDDQSSLGMLQDVATSLTGQNASTSGSGSGSLFGSDLSGSGTGTFGGLKSLGTAALSTVQQALQAYAAVHGVQFAPAAAPS